MSTTTTEAASAERRASPSTRQASCSLPRPSERTCAATPRSGTGCGSTNNRRDAPPPREPASRRECGRGKAASSPRTSRKDRSSYRSRRDLFRQLAFQDTPRAVQPAHDRADRDVEDLRGVGIAELADVHEHEDVAEVVRHVCKRVDDRSLRELLDHALLVERPAVRFLDLVVEVVVRMLVDRRRLRRALLAATAVDVQVREDAKQPGAKVRAGSERPPAAERARVGFLHQVFGFLARADEVPRDAENLVGEVQRFFLETNTITCLLGNTPGVCFRWLAHARPP